MADIKERIQKLLSLATSPNENEAKAALLKAKELMAKHKLTDADFKKEDELVHLLCEDVEWTTDSGKIWLVKLCTLIADNYLCTASWQTKKGTRTHTLVITGLSEDANICKEVMGYAIGFVESRVDYLQRKRRDVDGKTVANSYATGFTLGLEIAFEMQKDEHPEWGLVVVKPQEVNDYEQELGNRNVKTKKTGFDPASYMKGQVDGKNFNAQRVLAEAN